MEIVDYILAPVTTMANIEHLKILIEDYLVEFKTLYPECHLTPKCHYLIHVPSWMSRYRTVNIIIIIIHIIKIAVCIYYTKSFPFIEI